MEVVRGQRTYSLLQVLPSTQIFRFNNLLFVVILRKPKFFATNAMSDKAHECFLLSTENFTWVVLSQNYFF